MILNIEIDNFLNVYVLYNHEPDQDKKYFLFMMEFYLLLVVFIIFQF